MKLFQHLQRAVVTIPPRPPDITLPKTFQMVNGQVWPYGGFQTLTGTSETIATDFAGLVQGAYKANGVVFAVELARRSLFMQARFQYQNMDTGRPGRLWGDKTLRLLEKPWRNGTTGDLLAKMIDYADLGGDAFIVKRPGHLTVLRPDWVIVVSGSFDDREMAAADVDAEELGILYYPGGIRSGVKPQAFLATEYAHFMPLPDPLVVGRGMSWLVPVVREIEADLAMTAHKGKFFVNGATVNLVVTGVPGSNLNEFNDWVAGFEKSHKGLANAYRTLYLSGATKAEAIGSNLQQAEFRQTQGAGEVRICIAGGVPPTVVGVSEGLQGSSLNAGNFSSSMRRFADLTMRPLWQNAAGSLEAIFTVQSSSRLWYDDRDIPALKDDIKDAAEVRAQDSTAMKTLIDGGFEPDWVVDAVTTGDLSKLKGHHTGLNSVQLQKPDDGTEPKPEPPTEPDPNPDMPMVPPPGGAK